MVRCDLVESERFAQDEGVRRARDELVGASKCSTSRDRLTEFSRTGILAMWRTFIAAAAAADHVISVSTSRR